MPVNQIQTGSSPQRRFDFFGAIAVAIGVAISALVFATLQ
jgi:hypothetical protein